MSQSKNILVIGGGGREHAIIVALRRSVLCSALYCSPGNGGIARDAQCVALNSEQDIITFCQTHAIDLVVIGPEQPLVDGLSDALRAHNIAVFGPSQAAAQLEASKAFTKDICNHANIPTATYGEFTDADAAHAYIDKNDVPIVVKADGLAAGKGVIICHDRETAHVAIDSIFGGQFGEAGNRLIIEAFLEGEELSFFALCDGERAVPFGSAQDHKAAYDGDTGPNTGGMGTYSPAPVMDATLQQRIMNDIVMPAMREMSRRNTPYQGILFVGLMINGGEPTLIEFNARLGDPETQVILTRLQTDLLMLLCNAADGALPDAPLSFTNDAALCVVMASQGYPDAYKKNTEIRNLTHKFADNVTVFHAGTKHVDGEVFHATGGRVLGVTALAPTVAQAQRDAYSAVATIDWKEGYYRTDIGWRAVEREQDK